MCEYTPTTDEVRECWAMAEVNPDGYIADGLPVPNEIEQYAEFNRWLEQVKAAARREGQAEGWDEGFEVGTEAGGRWTENGGPDNDDPNPYRETGDGQ